jgi:hypothetical protein
MHPRTEGNQSLPNGAPMAPMSLGAIKGTPRRIEHYTKHLLNILQHRDITFTPLLRQMRFEEVFWAVILLCCLLCFSLNLCACVTVILSLVYVSTPPYSCGLFEINCVRCERLQIVEIPRNGKTWDKKENCGTQIDHLLTWEGLSATLVRWDATTWSGQAFYVWPNHEIKIIVSLV